jgi:hypothetical protein
MSQICLGVSCRLELPISGKTAIFAREKPIIGSIYTAKNAIFYAMVDTFRGPTPSPTPFTNARNPDEKANKIHFFL